MVMINYPSNPTNITSTFYTTSKHIYNQYNIIIPFLHLQSSLVSVEKMFIIRGCAQVSDPSQSITITTKITVHNWGRAPVIE